MKSNQMLFSRVKKGVYSLMVLAAIATTVTSCKKDDDNNNNQTTPTASIIPTISDADAALIAVNTITNTSTPIGPIEVPLGTGVAVFMSTTGGTTFVDAGAVTLLGEALTKQDNNSYVYMPSASSPNGLDLEGASSIDWTVAGAGSVPAINHSVNRSFPDLGEITSDTADLKTSDDFTLEVASVSNADSVMFQLAGQNEVKTYTRGSGTTSYTFDAADIVDAGAGYAVIQVVAYNWESDMVGGKKIYYINETVRSIVVYID